MSALLESLLDSTRLADCVKNDAAQRPKRGSPADRVLCAAYARELRALGALTNLGVTIATHNRLARMTAAAKRGLHRIGERELAAMFDGPLESDSPRRDPYLQDEYESGLDNVPTARQERHRERLSGPMEE